MYNLLLLPGIKEIKHCQGAKISSKFNTWVEVIVCVPKILFWVQYYVICFIILSDIFYFGNRSFLSNYANDDNLNMFD